MATFCKDLDSFSTHGKRTTINCDDVRLLCRRNPQIAEKLEESYRELNQTSSTGTKSKKKKATTTKGIQRHDTDSSVASDTMATTHSKSTTKKTTSKFAKVLKSNDNDPDFLDEEIDISVDTGDSDYN